MLVVAWKTVSGLDSVRTGSDKGNSSGLVAVAVDEMEVVESVEDPVAAAAEMEMVKTAVAVVGDTEDDEHV